MTTAPGPTQDTFFQGVRILSLAMIAAVALFGVVAVLTLGGLGEYPSPAVSAGLFGANVCAFAVAELMGYRTPAAPAGDDEAAHDLGRQTLQSTTTFRLVVTEAPAVASLVLAFVLGSGWTYVVGGFWALLFMAWHGYPSRRVLARLERSLDREGGRSRLTELADGPSTPGRQQH